LAPAASLSANARRGLAVEARRDRRRNSRRRSRCGDVPEANLAPCAELRNRICSNSSTVCSRLCAVIDAVKPCPATPACRRAGRPTPGCLRPNRGLHIGGRELEVSQTAGSSQNAHGVLGADTCTSPTPVTRDSRLLHRGVDEVGEIDPAHAGRPSTRNRSPSGSCASIYHLPRLLLHASGSSGSASCSLSCVCTWAMSGRCRRRKSALPWRGQKSRIASSCRAVIEAGQLLFDDLRDGVFHRLRRGAG